MVYKETLCPFECHTDFECVCVKEHKHDKEGEVEHINDSDTATSSNETPPHLKKQSKPQEKLNLTMTSIVIQLILKLGLQQQLNCIMVQHASQSDQHQLLTQLRYF